MLIRRYVAREVAVTLAAVAGVLYLIYVSHRLVRFLAEAGQGAPPGGLLAQLLALKSLSNLPALLPLALFLAVLLVFGRLHRDGEAVAMAACGVDPLRLVQAVMGVAVPVAALVGAVALALGPWAERRAAALEARAAAQAELEALVPGRFRSFRGGRVVFYARERGAHGGLEEVLVRTLRRGGAGGPAAEALITAQRARLLTDAAGHRYLELEEGWRYEGWPEAPGFRMVRFRRHGVLLRPAPPPRAGLPWAARPTEALGRGARARAELHWRLAFPLATPLLALLAVALGRARPRQGRAGRVLAALTLYVVYMNLLALGRTWLGQGQLPAWAGLWWVHLPVFLLGLGLLAREQGRRLPRGAAR